MVFPGAAGLHACRSPSEAISGPISEAGDSFSEFAGIFPETCREEMDAAVALSREEGNVVGGEKRGAAAEGRGAAGFGGVVSAMVEAGASETPAAA